ncbi:importin subunit alpha-4 [Anaeramoeba flamelloides]|uniref:Importin subunit alpha-4 n=1 Tax=Anaeramoeba flamelloides TaxID=1746091 RepID=A0ABQ8YMX6_9EUKA|nr:importin subunit alpha-4 [Anaeramoeba flamelloides]
MQSEDLSILVNSFWGLCYLSNGDLNNIQLILDLKILPIIFENLKKNIPDLVVPSLRIIGNILSGDSEQAQEVIDQDGIKPLKLYLLDNKPKLRKEACWAISNICAGTIEQIQEIYENDLIDPLLLILKQDELPIQIEACYSITSIMMYGNVDQINFLISKNVLEIFSELLNSTNFNILNLILESLDRLFNYEITIKNLNNIDYEETNNFVTVVEEYGGMKAIEKITQSQNQNLSKLAQNILTKYYYQEKNSKESIKNK